MPAAGAKEGAVPVGEVMASVSPRWGAAAQAAANFEENSPKLRCWLRASTSEKLAASQKAVAPPLPRATS